MHHVCCPASLIQQLARAAPVCCAVHQLHTDFLELGVHLANACCMHGNILADVLLVVETAQAGQVEQQLLLVNCGQAQWVTARRMLVSLPGEGSTIGPLAVPAGAC